ncbi:transcription antiterminator [Atopobacter sp. AH10]|uniref:PRD domain-containing protein n=1 Tax=Atopobacter sp. AH10 TaxID=2315861 RepID=UPI000EF286A3|nr:transcription antiterminator [Atopobacter sp. AH10]RLK63435.1 transcription antiterminator [Atopobacter sp. AH10]
MYRVIRPLNNNVALVKNERNEEAVVTGLGLAFKKKKGDVIPKEKIEKVFQLRSEEAKNDFMSLLKDVPLDFITVTFDVIEKLTRKYHYPVQDYLYITLTDHMYCAYKALQTDSYVYNELPDIALKYPSEYAMAREALQIFRSSLLESYPDDELGRIALHFINAKGISEATSGGKIDNRKAILEAIEAELIANGIKRSLENSNFYDRFMVHLNYFLDYIDRSKEETSSLLDMEKQVAIAYPKAFKIANAIYDIISRETGVDLYKSERFYLVIHIQRLLK